MKKLIIFFAIVFILPLPSCKEYGSVEPENRITSIPILEGKIKREFYEQLLTHRHTNISVPIILHYKDEFINAEAEPQGAGSRYYPKWSYEILFAPDKNISGLNHFNLSAQVADEAMILTTLTSHVYKKMGFKIFHSDDVFFHLNGKDQGLYKIIERINKTFFLKRGLPVYELIKVGFDAKFTFTIPNDLSENFDVDIPEEGNFENLVSFIHTLDTVKAENAYTVISNYLDIDNYLKYHAISTIIAHLDGFKNNMYLYKSGPYKSYEVIPWDFDRTFSDNFDKLYYGENAIVEKLFMNDTCRQIYKEHYKYFLENIFLESELYPVIDSAYSNIKEGYYSDPYLGLGGKNLEDKILKYKSFISSRRILLLNNFENFPF